MDPGTRLSYGTGPLTWIPTHDSCVDSRVPGYPFQPIVYVQEITESKPFSKLELIEDLASFIHLKCLTIPNKFYPTCTTIFEGLDIFRPPQTENFKTLGLAFINMCSLVY